MKYTLMCLIATLFFTARADALDGKTLAHVISIPVIEGTGIYASVKMIRTGTTNNTAAAITNLSLIGINAGMGAYTLFGKPTDYSKWRTTHRIVGFAASAAAIWLAISAGRDSDITRVDKGVAIGYSALTVVPVVLFSF